MIAFYAPLKAPDHPVPSGDREMARALIAALQPLGPVTLASGLRSLDLAGDAAAQARLRAKAEAEVERLIRELPHETRIWLTYHNYYKAPDLIGPAVCAARGLAYVQVESTRAKKRLTGPWAGFAASAEAASDAAQVIFYLTERDGETLARDRAPGQQLVHLRPFLPRPALPDPAPLAEGAPMLAAAMMRPGDKLASYALIAEALALMSGDWTLDIAGDGPARPEVAALMAPFGARVRFLGRLDAEGMAAAYQRAGLFLWPGVNEAFGMVYLEAQAAGLPVVAQDRPGMREVLATPPCPVEGGPAALAAHATRLLADRAERQAQGAAARAHIARHHLLEAASATLAAALTPLEPRP
ncbi:glycosyltransferase family 4 protein [Seohaeicola zhoushanensis]|uniref:Glycosyl transferase n=1 Tax=Seohaeicola zhoushanensis TaxID=1569283 RepID=A0A8J3M5M9_9RHOB|nr:glycosyl transferase [Seohaeicola zhoushanensis]